MGRRRARRKPPNPKPEKLPDAPPEPRTRLQTAWIVARHAVPIVVLIASGGSITAFVTLTVFNLALTAAVFNAIKTATRLIRGGTPEEQGSISVAEALDIASVAVIQALLVTAAFGWAPLFATESFKYLLEPELWWGGLLLIAAAVPEAVTRVRQRARSGVYPPRFESQDHMRIRRVALALIYGFGGGIFLARLGTYGLWPMAFGYTACSLYYELYPERLVVRKDGHPAPPTIRTPEPADDTR